MPEADEGTAEHPDASPRRTGARPSRSSCSPRARRSATRSSTPGWRPACRTRWTSSRRSRSRSVQTPNRRKEIPMTQGFTTCLWFDGQAEEAANYYTSIFKNSKLGRVGRYTEAGPGPAGSVLAVEFELNGQKFVGAERRAGVHVQRGDLVPDLLRGPGRGGLLLEQALRGRRGERLRLAEGQVRRVLAGRSPKGSSRCSATPTPRRRSGPPRRCTR